MCSMVKAEGLTKFYGELEALSDVSFAVGEGEVLGLVGPNGAGKTTCLRILCGMIPPTRGVVHIGRHMLSEEPVEAKRLLAFIPDEPHLFDYLTVAEHLQFLARVYRLGDVSARAKSLLAEFELADKANDLPPTLSRGMKQKAAICCGFLHNPRAIFFDEPLTGLDPVAIRRMKDAIRNCAHDGVAIVISSHLLGLVEELCHRVLIIKSGKTVACGTRDEIAKLVPHIRADSSLEDIFLEVTTNAAELRRTTDAQS